MSPSVHNADRATHLRIVVVALIASTAIVAFSLAARVTSYDSYAVTVRATPNVSAELPAGAPGLALPAEVTARPI